MASKNINLVTSVVCWCWTRPWQFSHQGYFILKIVQVLFAQYICSIIYIIIIRCKLFFLFIGWKPTKWPANNCLQIMVCSCAMLSNYVWLQPYSLKNKLGDRMIKQLLNSVIAKYCDLPVSRTSIICLSLQLRKIIDLLATEKSLYFAQPRPIIVKYWQISIINCHQLSTPGICVINE